MPLRTDVGRVWTSRRRSERLGFAGVALALALNVGVAPVARASAAAASPSSGRVTGVVVDASTGSAVSGATVTLPAFGARTTSGSDGSFSFPGAFPTTTPYRRISAVVTARGYGAWTITGVPLSPGDELRLRAELGRAATTHDVLTPQERAALHLASRVAAPLASGNTCTGWSSPLAPPATIRVYRTKTGVVQQYDFLFYVQHVLPDEWISSWDADALGAGAVAAKSYAMYREYPGHAYSGGAGCADISDWTNDQVFDPTWSTAATDQAVDATFGTMLLKGGATPLAQYWSGSSSDRCAAVTSGPFAGRMSQWGTQACAKQGMLWPQIVTTFYPADQLSYVRNLLLDGDLQYQKATSVWKVSQGAKKRVRSGGSGKGPYLRLTPDASGGSVSQTRPFLGTSSTRYTYQLALLCQSSAGACSVTLQVGVVSTRRSRTVDTWTVSVPNDGAWHSFGRTTPSAGATHTAVQLSVLSADVLGLDAAFLTAPFGGP